VEQLGSLLLGAFATSIVAGGGLDLGVAGEALDGAEIGTDIQQMGDEPQPAVTSLRISRTATPATMPGRSALLLPATLR
jgi:hypothetical protein